jgi:hypothetical protein
MGLDVYLYRCADRKAAAAVEKQYNQESEKIWEDEALSSDVALAQSEALAERLGLDDCGQHPSRERVAINSTIDPEHMFKVGYFRSSYNSGGINHVLDNLGFAGLYQIMGVGWDVSEPEIDWDEALRNANQAISAYEAHLASPAGKYRVDHIRPMGQSGADGEKAALELFVGQLQAMPTSDMRDFSNGDGHFFLDGKKVCAIIPEQAKAPTGNPMLDMLNQPGVFVISEKEPSEKRDWYLTALLIVKETIEYVLAQPDRENYYMVWSG